MQDWQEQWTQMRAQFMTRAQERLCRVEGLLQELHQQRTAELLGEVRNHFHWLSGVGGTYKLPEVSDIGNQGEQLCNHHLEAGSVPDESEVNELHELLDRVRTRIQSEL